MNLYNELKDLQMSFALTDFVEPIIDEAYQLYMPQVRSEITDLTEFVIKNTLLKDGKPINILEIGTKFGGTFYIWNKINPDGINISIDISDGGQHGGILDEEMDKRDVWFLERFNNCHFIRGDSHDYGILNQFSWKLRSNDLKDFSEPIEIDFLFIDGDHTHEGVKSDFEMYSEFVRKQGLICFHDIVISEHHHSRNVYVGEFWREITKNEVAPMICNYNGIDYFYKEFIGSEEQNWAGIGILKKL